MTGKRLLACSLFGIIAGALDLLVMHYVAGAPISFTPAIISGFILNRAFIGFTLGISGWRTNWAFHGVVIGLVGSLPLAVFAFGDQEGLTGFLLIELFGGMWGFFIELCALAVKAKKKG